MKNCELEKNDVQATSTLYDTFVYLINPKFAHKSDINGNT